MTDDQKTARLFLDAAEALRRVRSRLVQLVNW